MKLNEYMYFSDKEDYLNTENWLVRDVYYQRGYSDERIQNIVAMPEDETDDRSITWTRKYFYDKDQQSFQLESIKHKFSKRW